MNPFLPSCIDGHGVLSQTRNPKIGVWLGGSVCLGNRFLRPRSFWNCDPILFMQEFLLPVWSLFLQCGGRVKGLLRKEERGKERGEKEKPVPKNQLQRKECEGLLSGASTRAARSSPCHLSSLALSPTVSRSVMALITRTV